MERVNDLMTRLDILDKSISSLVFYREIGGFSEYVLSIPGVWFGCPSTALIWWPCVLVFFREPQNIHWQMIFAGTTVFFVMTWYWFLWRGSHQPMYSAKPLVPGMLAMMTAIYHYAAPASFGFALFYLVCFFFAQVFVKSGKVFFQRVRPGVCMQQELQAVTRSIPTLHYRYPIDDLGSNAYESFPSGDACGASVAISVLVLLGSHIQAAYLIVAITGFMRMYLFAHHFLDVLVGILFGKLAVEVLRRFRAPELYGPAECAIVAILFGLFFLLMSKLSAKRTGKTMQKW